MGDRWIVSDYRFHQHTSVRSALLERDRLRALHPEKKYRAHRIKTTLQQANSGPYIRQLEARVKELEAQITVPIVVQGSELAAMAVDAYHAVASREIGALNEALELRTSQLVCEQAEVLRLKSIYETDSRADPAPDEISEKVAGIGGPCPCFPLYGLPGDDDSHHKGGACQCFPDRAHA